MADAAGAKQKVVVLGAGVIGLSVALELCSRGYDPVVVGRDLPDDVDSVGFASPWAVCLYTEEGRALADTQGCNWFPFDADGALPTSRRERLTFPGLAKLSQARPDLCQKIPFYNVWDSDKPDEQLWFHDLVGDVGFLHANVEKVPGSRKYGTKFESFILHAPKYTQYLAEELRKRDIKMIRKRVSSLDEVYELEGVGTVDLVVHASGLGAKSLIGVQDEAVYPARGQTVLVRAPWCPKVCVMDAEGFNAVVKPGDPPLPDPAYIIPRPGPEGHFILGGTYIRDDYSTLPDLATAKRILQGCYALLPELAPPGGGWEDIEVLSHNVGLRPARNGGPKIVLEEYQLSEGKGVGVGTGEGRTAGRKVGVVHCYGFGSAGCVLLAAKVDKRFQQSLGAAQEASDLVDQYFKK